MNGIYDFEGYGTPYLDVEMLMERKAQKRARRMLVLSCVAAILMAVLAVLLLWNMAIISSKLLVIAYMGFAIYMIAGVAVFGVLLKKVKGDNVCLA